MFLRSRIFLNCAPGKSVLKLKARPRAPEFAYIHAPAAPYKGTQQQWRVQSESTQLRKQLGKQQERKLCPSEKQPVHRWAREDFTGAEVEVMLQGVELKRGILFCSVNEGYKPSQKNEAWDYITIIIILIFNVCRVDVNVITNDFSQIH